jgi:hypothetical protein
MKGLSMRWLQSIPRAAACCAAGFACVLLSAGNVRAQQLIGFDDFSGYAANLANLDSCDVTDGWTAYADTSSVDPNTVSFKEGTASLQLSYSPSSGRSTAHKSIMAVDLTSMNNIGFWAYVGDNAHSQHLEIRIGQAGNYQEYRYAGEIFQGWTYAEFDLSNPYAVVGSPDMTSVDYLWVGYYYGSGETGTYWLVDGVSAYTSPNFTAGNFYYINNAILYGVAGHQIHDGTNELLVNGISRYNSGNHGRVLYLTSTPTSFYASFDFRFNADDNGVGWMRFLWDFVDGHNYRGIYIARDRYNKTGIEQFVDNRRVNQEIGFTAVVGRSYHVDVWASGDDVELYIDGVGVMTSTVPASTLAGPFAFESYSGNIDLDQGFTTTVAISNVAIYEME